MEPRHQDDLKRDGETKGLSSGPTGNRDAPRLALVLRATGPATRFAAS